MAWVHLQLPPLTRFVSADGRHITGGGTLSEENSLRGLA